MHALPYFFDPFSSCDTGVPPTAIFVVNRQEGSMKRHNLECGDGPTTYFQNKTNKQVKTPKASVLVRINENLLITTAEEVKGWDMTRGPKNDHNSTFYHKRSPMGY